MNEKLSVRKLLRTVRTCNRINTAEGFNSIIFYLRKIPLIGKHIPEAIYGYTDFKAAISALRWIVKVFSVLFNKALYLLLMVCLPALIFKDNIPWEQTYRYSMNALVFLSFFCGALYKNVLLENKREKYICIRLMRLPSNYYLVGDYILGQFTDLVGFVFTIPIFTLIYGRGISEGIICAFMLIACHLAGEVLTLFIFDKTGVVLTDKIAFNTPIIIVGLALAYIPLLVDIPIFAWDALYRWPVIFLIIAVGAASFYYIFNYKHYSKVALDTVKSTGLDVVAEIKKAQKSDVEIREKDLDSSKNFQNLSGYQYINSIFVSRHRRLLYRAALIRVAIISAVFVTAVALLLFVPSTISEYVDKLPNTLPFCVFVMYLLTTNTQTVCKAMYANCDNSLLHYGFYRQPRVILQNFKIRLYKLLKPNLVVSGTLALAVAGFSLIAGLNWNPLQMLLYMVSLVLLGVFFTVHYLFMYYFFQPYTTELTIKSPAVSVINYLIYILCFVSLQLESTPSFFTPVVLIFTIVYIAAALILIYKYAPKNFRIK